MVAHDFIVRTNWQGGRNVSGQLNGDILNETISIPAALGGIGEGTNPDELLVSAASGCYIISLAAVLERANFTDIQITQTSTGTAVFEQGKFKMTQIKHEARISVAPHQKHDLERKIQKLSGVADRNCMISNAVRNNVDIVILPTIV